MKVYAICLKSKPIEWADYFADGCDCFSTGALAIYRTKKEARERILNHYRSDTHEVVEYELK